MSVYKPEDSAETRDRTPIDTHEYITWQEFFFLEKQEEYKYDTYVQIVTSYASKLKTPSSFEGTLTSIAFSRTRQVKMAQNNGVGIKHRKETSRRSHHREGTVSKERIVRDAKLYIMFSWYLWLGKDLWISG